MYNTNKNKYMKKKKKPSEKGREERKSNLTKESFFIFVFFKTNFNVLPQIIS